MKKTNKGFSLVELIIVIAIMAILIGVLAPQYIKYVEKSRKSADEDNADNFLNAAMTACTDDEYIDGIDGNSKIKFGHSGAANATAVTGSSLSAALGEYFAKWNTTFVKSKAYSGSHYEVTITSVPSTGALKASGTWTAGA